MVELKEQIINYLTTDSSLKTLLGATITDTRIYPNQSNQLEKWLNTPNTGSFMTYKETPGEWNYSPRKSLVTIFEFNIYSKINLKAVEDIYSRLSSLLNYYYTPANRVVRWGRQIAGGGDIEETDRQLFHKIIRYQFWSITN